jgi:hypothetical protein
MSDHASPEVAAVQTVGGVLTDLVEVAEMLPVPPGQSRDVARILDRLSEEISEAAQMLRAASGTVSAPAAAPPGPAYNPWGVVRLVTRELARDKIKSRFGPEAGLSEVVGHAARLLEALGVVPVAPAGDDGLSAAFPSWRTAPAARIDGSVPVDDERVTRARALLAEQHQPLTMTPGDVRKLLARFQRRTVELLEVIDARRY